MAYIAGIDLGAGATKAVIMDESHRVVGRGIVKTQADFEKVADGAMTMACEEAGVSRDAIEYVASTGLGRYSLIGRNIQITDLTCGARGAHAAYPEARFVLDMGAQSTRAISLRDGGRVKSFRTNEKCAAGSGGFLERICRYLEVSIDEIGELSLTAEDPQPISSVCAVLAESEIINHVSEGKSVADIFCGAHQSLAERALSQLKMTGCDGAVVFIGGVARQAGMVNACREKFGQEVLVPKHPSHAVAHGAAILGLQRFLKRATPAAEGVAAVSSQ